MYIFTCSRSVVENQFEEGKIVHFRGEIIIFVWKRHFPVQMLQKMWKRIYPGFSSPVRQSDEISQPSSAHKGGDARAILEIAHKTCAMQFRVAQPKIARNVAFTRCILFDCTQLSCMQPAVHTIQFDCATGIFALRNQKVAPSELSLKNGFRFTPNFKIDFGGFKLGKFYLIIGINIQILFERFEWRLCHIWLSYEGSNLVKTTSYRKMKSLKPFVEYTLLNTRKCVINELELAQFVVNNYLQIIEQEIWEE